MYTNYYEPPTSEYSEAETDTYYEALELIKKYDDMYDDGEVDEEGYTEHLTTSINDLYTLCLIGDDMYQDLCDRIQTF